MFRYNRFLTAKEEIKPWIESLTGKRIDYFDVSLKLHSNGHRDLT